TDGDRRCPTCRRVVAQGPISPPRADFCSEPNERPVWGNPGSSLPFARTSALGSPTCLDGPPGARCAVRDNGQVTALTAPPGTLSIAETRVGSRARPHTAYSAPP